MGRPKKEKDPNEGLPEGFAEAVASMSTDQIRQKMADIVLLDIAMHDAMEQDDDYQKAKEVFEELAAPYKEDFKSFKLQIKTCKRILDDKNGGAISAKLEVEHLAAKEAKRTAGLRVPEGVERMEISAGGRTVTLTAETRKRIDTALDAIKNPPGHRETGGTVSHKPIGSKDYKPLT